ncbi:GntR family transcriptional regulator [Salinisphaera aquimarina]|uniref:GntR family transcriptional regulator n=1 Tax=Salinisphaera aquimarina TaxID=2094031 RepID=A0ABV7ES45_9GAMM
MSDDDYELFFSGQPRYRAVAQTLVREIQNGHYPEGAMLPTENELCERFSVSRHTIREAFRRLQDVGLISRKAGVGTQVISSEISSRYIHASNSITDLMQYVRDVRLEIRGQEEIVVDEPLSELLETAVGSRWTHISGLRYLNTENVPIAITNVYLPPEYQVFEADLSSHDLPIYKVLEQRYRLKVVRIDQQISAVTIDSEAAERLQVEEKSAGLKVIRKYYADDDVLLEVAVSLHHGERFTYSVSQQLEIQKIGKTR